MPPTLTKVSLAMSEMVRRLREDHAYYGTTKAVRRATVCELTHNTPVEAFGQATTEPVPPRSVSAASSGL